MEQLPELARFSVWRLSNAGGVFLGGNGGTDFPMRLISMRLFVGDLDLVGILEVLSSDIHSGDSKVVPIAGIFKSFLSSSCK